MWVRSQEGVEINARFDCGQPSAKDPSVCGGGDAEEGGCAWSQEGEGHL